MPRDTDRKVPNTISLTRRQTDVVRKESARLGISFGDMVRRIVDEWLERKPTLSQKLYQGAER